MMAASPCGLDLGKHHVVVNDSKGRATELGPKGTTSILFFTLSMPLRHDIADA
jgi:hypothetical protein